MARFKQYSYTPNAASTTRFGTGFTGVGPFTMTNTTTLDTLAHLVSLTSAANLSGITMTLTGTDTDGKAMTEAVTGPNANTVYSTKYFKTLTSITASSTLGASTMDVGIKDAAVLPTWPVDYKQNPVSVGLGITLTGTINVTVQHTFDDVFDNTIVDGSRVWLNHASLASKTANSDGNYSAPIRATRLLINSLTNGATIKFTIIQGNS